MNKNPFYLPVVVDDRTRSGLQEFQLYVKDDPSRPWTLKDRQGPATTSFQFRPPQDGEYWFMVVTVDKYGRQSPADVSREGPQVVVVFDTQPPLVEIQQQPPSADGQWVKCEVRDLNPAPEKTRFEYQRADQQWCPGDTVSGQPDLFLIPAQVNFSGRVKVTAFDRAGNFTVRELDLRSTTAASINVGAQDRTPPKAFPLPQGVPAVKSFPPPGNPPPAVAQGSRGATNDGPILNPQGPGPEAGPRIDHDVMQATVRQQPAPQGGVPEDPTPVQPYTPHEHHVAKSPATPRNTGLPPTRKIVKDTHIKLEYQIAATGASGVGKVVVYMTPDQGQSWQMLCEDPDRRSPVEIELPREGIFGIRLVASNGHGFGADRPAPGETPDWWIEVDKTKPFVEMGSVSPGSGDDAAALWITWTARDKNLLPEPVDLYYAATREGPWTPIAKGIRNDGRYRWLAPAGMQLAYVRVVVTDKAGNTNLSETPQAVPLDDGTRPQVRVTNITAPGTGSRAPKGN
jgi:hypothetical protein